ncbi:MAG: MBOAT family protein [Leptospiraceae bacterium]|nr:MBOAT family protein [Leptospiraceae bacterium]
MLFNSLHFFGFLAVLLPLYFSVSEKNQRRILFLFSLYFYSCLKLVFVPILFLSFTATYVSAIQIQNSQTTKAKKLWLFHTLTVNLGILFLFKYLDFFRSIEYDLKDLLGLPHSNFEPVGLILPVGISFYTFQSMSYTIDVYRKKIQARKSFIDFALYVAFFPQLVAGPIVRAATFFRDLDFRLDVLNEDIQIAISRILVGFVRKIVFADNLGRVVDFTFQNYASLNPLEIWTGAIAFGWQIYLDFAGYTDIAIGVARLFGFKFDANFNFPMVTNNINDHWTKWHISFSTWIRDYIFIPLGGSREGELKTYRNLFITWFFAGIWHGAAYHFIAWGIWQAVMLGIHREYSKTSFHKWINERGGLAYDVLSRIFTKYCLAFGFVMFRAQTMQDAWNMIQSMLFLKGNLLINTYQNWNYGLLLAICYVGSYIFSKRDIEGIAAHKPHQLMYLNTLCAFLLLFFGITESQNFLYFAF